MHFSIKPSHPALQATSALISTDISLPLPINPDGSVTITHLDPLSRAKSVKLRHWLLGKRTPPSFTQVDDVRWELRFTLPPVHRFEYQLEITLGDDSTHTVIDPLNPFSFADRFSSKSIAYLPGYSEPMSIAPPPQESLGALEPITLPTLGEQTTTAALWHPHGFTMRDHLPLILFLDGPDYVNFAHADHVLANLVASRAIPPCRALFYPPQKRNEEYSANPGMPDFLTVDLPAALADHCPVPDNYRERFAIGASLAGLCLLHADFNRPNFFGGLLLQSGSYFQPQSDWMETDFPYFLRITGFVHTLLAATRMPHQHLPALHMTCGLGEENISNNRAMADNLARLRYPVRFVEHPDAHNWTSWQHCLGPGLIHLLNHASAK